MINSGDDQMSVSTNSHYPTRELSAGSCAAANPRCTLNHRSSPSPCHASTPQWIRIHTTCSCARNRALAIDESGATCAATNTGSWRSCHKLSLPPPTEASMVLGCQPPSANANQTRLGMATHRLAATRLTCATSLRTRLTSLGTRSCSTTRTTERKTREKIQQPRFHRVTTRALCAGVS